MMGVILKKGSTAIYVCKPRVSVEEGLEITQSRGFQSCTHPRGWNLGQPFHLLLLLQSGIVLLLSPVLLLSHFLQQFWVASRFFSISPACLSIPMFPPFLLTQQIGTFKSLRWPAGLVFKAVAVML